MAIFYMSFLACLLDDDNMMVVGGNCEYVGVLLCVCVCVTAAVSVHKLDSHMHSYCYGRAAKYGHR